MCGISGIINFNNKPVQENLVLEMMKTMKHRGPDDEGVFIDNNVGVGFVRLSIIDLSSSGHQPMFDETGRFMIIHNGEVYNYIELRSELIKKGYHFKSNTDSEVILKSYIEWGEDCLHKFNGMWSFVIYDKKTKEIFISRDRYGIKPFYYYSDKNKFIFASEIPSILKILERKPNPNYQALFDYLVFNRTDQTEMTFFEGIKKLQHGHVIKIQNSKGCSAFDGFEIHKWYDLKQKVKNTVPFKNPEEYKNTFSSAVGLRLRSDVPVGVCLSGGLDSSSIVSTLLKDFDKKDLNTFSAIYKKGSPGDESEYIKEYSSSLTNMFYTNPSAESLYADMDNFVTAHGEPVPSTSPYAQFKVMELAKNNVGVTLDGQGADEQLAGYHYFYGFYFKELLKNFRWLHLLSETYHYLNNHKSLYGVKTFLYFLLPKNIKSKARVAEKGYLNPEFVHNYSSDNQVTGNIYSSDSLNNALFNHFEYKLEHLLKWEDRNSMWFSLESRVPFLDYRLVEKTLATPAKNIIHKGMTKHILREAMKGVLPENIRNRKDKIGFDTPQDKWFRTPKFKTYIEDTLNSNDFKTNGFINHEPAQKLYKKHLDGEINIAKDIWKWINMDIWQKQF